MQVAADPEHPNKHHGTPPNPPCALIVLKGQQEEKVEELQPVGAKLF